MRRRGCSSGVEHNLAKVGVEGSNPFTRSNFQVSRSVDRGSSDCSQTINVLKQVFVLSWCRQGLRHILYKRNDIFHFSRAVPSDLKQCFDERGIEASLWTKSEVKATKSAAALSDRLERHWDSLSMEQIHLKELKLTVTNQPTITSKRTSVSIDYALAYYHYLTGYEKSDLFFKSSEKDNMKPAPNQPGRDCHTELLYG